MNTDFVNLTKENLSDEHLCCIIRSKKPHAGIDAKRQITYLCRPETFVSILILYICILTIY